MFLNFRYHLVSLIAIFLALGVGIVIGSMYVPSALVEKQSAMVRQLEKEFTSIQEETQNYKQELQKKEDFEKEVLPILVANKLYGYSLSIIETSGQTNDVMENILISLLKKAGANIQSIINIKDKLGFSNNNLKNNLLKHLGLQKESEESVYKNIFIRLANEICFPKNQNLINYLRAQKILQTRGDITVPAQLAIIIGNPQGKEQQKNFDYTDKVLIETLKANNKRVVAVETTKSYSQIEKYQKIKISTVDNIDTIPGQIALVFILAGYDGNFGFKKTAQAILPRVLVP